MKICIHRGTHQIGGTCIELTSQNKRLVLDLGIPLDAEIINKSLLPPIRGLLDSSPDLLGVIISHPHADHVGLTRFLHKDVPLYIGEASAHIINVSSKYIKDNKPISPTGFLSHEKNFQLGPFMITSFLVDHSAFDSYSLLVQSDGKRIFYSGDFRSHGRKKKLFDYFISHPPKHIDALLLEGSSLERIGNSEYFKTEKELEKDFIEHFKQNGPIFVWQSSQNIDRLTTVFRAAKQTNRRLIIDTYTAEILEATMTKTIPKLNWDLIDLYVPYHQRVQLKKIQNFDILNKAKQKRIFPEDLAFRLEKSVMLFRPLMIHDLNFINIQNAKCIYSMWSGNLNKEEKTLTWLKEKNINFTHIHTSGHASILDLQKLAKALKPKRIIPIHTFHPEKYPDLFSNVVIKNDGCEWEL